ncbi:MAG: replication protein A [Methanosarcinaceae archaeon]|nr:replication protein A [Methanosarcinaceae archaeon]
MKEISQDINARFLELGVEIPVGDIEERLDKMVNKFKVPKEEARRSVINYFLKEYNIPRDEFYPSRSEGLKQISELSTDGEWVNLKAKVVQLWENTHESISQVGLIGDETGIIKFTKWENAELPDIEDGQVYLFRNVIVKEWSGKFQVNLNKSSSIERLAEDLDTGASAGKFASAMGESESPRKKVSELNADGQWVSVKAKVVQLWENSHESISQVGLIGDETGTIKFTKWASAELPDIEEGKSYLFRNVVTNEWNGKFQVDLNKSSSIESIDEDMEVGTSTTTFTGAMVDIQSGSGLIKRCPECNRALTKGACMEHGKVDGIYDLRIKAVMDDGITTQDAIIKRDVAEQITGLTLENAIALAADALDQGVVLEQMKKVLVGKYYTISGTRLDRYLLVDSIDELEFLDQKELDELINAAEAV